MKNAGQRMRLMKHGVDLGPGRIVYGNRESAAAELNIEGDHHACSHP